MHLPKGSYQAGVIDEFRHPTHTGLLITLKLVRGKRTSEYGKAQYEVTCRPTQGVAAADRAVNVREITREIARQMGLDISFSPKLVKVR